MGIDSGSDMEKKDGQGVCTGGPCPYLPGNGGLLYAIAMMAAGWDGAPDRSRISRRWDMDCTVGGT